MKPSKLILFVLLPLFLGSYMPKPETLALSYHYTVTVSGAVNRQINQKEFYLEPAGEGLEHIYIQELGPGEDIKVLDIVFPKSDQSETYQLTSDKPANGAYFEFVDNVSRQFHDNVEGTLTVNQSGRMVSGSFNFIAQEPLSNEWVRVIGEYEFERPVEAPETPPLDAPYQNTEISPGFNEGLFVLIFGVLVFLNFVIQTYIGRIVYAGQSLWVLRVFRSTRTYILGWRDPSLRDVMFVWTLVILLISGVILLYGVLRI